MVSESGALGYLFGTSDHVVGRNVAALLVIVGVIDLTLGYAGILEAARVPKEGSDAFRTLAAMAAEYLWLTRTKEASP